MEKIKILTDSTCDLSPELISKYRIPVIPFYVSIGEETFKDGKTFSTDKLYQYVEKFGHLPKTGAPSPEDYRIFFQKYIDEGYKIIYIALSSFFSSGYQNACLAAKHFPAGMVEVIDSQNLSTGIGLLVMKAIDFLNEGKDKTYIIKQLSEIIPQLRTSFIIDNLDYLYKGGRCSGLQRFFGNMLRFRIEVEVAAGKMNVAAKIRGTKKKALNKLIANLKNDLHIIDKTRIFITHSWENEGAKYIKEQLENISGINNIFITNAGSVISSHCGPGTIGILYISKEK